jgi:hypothetical protein
MARLPKAVSARPRFQPDPSKLGDPAEIARHLTALQDSTLEEVARVAALPGIPRGTGFPTVFATNDLFFRTDRGILYFYDGTRWLSVQEFQLAMPCYTQLPSTAIAAAINANFLACLPQSDGGSIYVTKWAIALSPGAPNDGANFWTIRLGRVVAAAFTYFATITTAALAAAEQRAEVKGINTIVATDSATRYLVGSVTLKTLAPGNLVWEASTVHYRLVG